MISLRVQQDSDKLVLGSKVLLLLVIQISNQVLPLLPLMEKVIMMDRTSHASGIGATATMEVITRDAAVIT